MKTTVQIADPLLASAKEIARADRTTLGALIEEGLRKVVAERSRKARPFRLDDASVGGRGINPDFAGSWEAIRDAVYSGRGG